MNYFLPAFALYIFYLLPRYLIVAGYVRLPYELDLHTKRKADLICLFLAIVIAVALADFEKSLFASPVVQSATTNILKAFERVFQYSDVTQPLVAVVIPYLFPVSYSYILAVAIFAALIFTPTSALLFVFLLCAIFFMGQVFALGIIKKRFEPDFRVRLVHAAIGYSVWLVAVNVRFWLM